MKVSRTNSTKPASSSRRTSRTASSSGGAFSDHLDRISGDTGKGLPVADTTAASTTGAILAAQEVSESADGTGRRRMRQHGEDILDRLDEIRHDILRGAISKQKLENLAQLLRARRQTVDDPQLIEIIKDIELRAAVEIAKYSRNT